MMTNAQKAAKLQWCHENDTPNKRRFPEAGSMRQRQTNQNAVKLCDAFQGGVTINKRARASSAFTLTGE